MHPKDALTSKLIELLGPPAFTMTGLLPSAVPAGIWTLTDVSLQLPGSMVSAAPPMVTVDAPWEPPKPVPVILNPIKAGPEVNERLVIVGPAGAGASSNVELLTTGASNPTATLKL